MIWGRDARLVQFCQAFSCLEGFVRLGLSKFMSTHTLADLVAFGFILSDHHPHEIQITGERERESRYR